MFLIVYTPNDPNNSAQEQISTAIKALGNWSDRMQHAWFLETNISAGSVRDRLKQFINPNDRIFVSRITRHWSGFGMGTGFPEWLNRRQFGQYSEMEAGSASDDNGQT
jgi:hypothetical protein